jgi:hypothetical protein
MSELTKEQLALIKEHVDKWHGVLADEDMDVEGRMLRDLVATIEARDATIDRLTAECKAHCDAQDLVWEEVDAKNAEIATLRESFEFLEGKDAAEIEKLEKVIKGQAIYDRVNLEDVATLLVAADKRDAEIADLRARLAKWESCYTSPDQE